MASQTQLSRFFAVPQKRAAAADKSSYERKRSRSFVKSWAESFNGLIDTENGMVCTTCQQHPEKAGNTLFKTGCTSYRLDSVKAHFATTRHVLCRDAYNLAQGKTTGTLDSILDKIGEEEAEIMKRYFNTVYYIMKFELPWGAFPNLLALQTKNGSNMSRMQSYHTDKACARFGTFIAESIRESIQEALRGSRVLAIMFDGATDCSVSEVEVIYCRVIKNGTPTEFFVGLQDLEHAHSEGVYNSIDQAMNNIGCEDWQEKIVGAGSDGASVNIGNKNSVKTRLLDGHPYIVFTHCVAHRLELGVLSAIKDSHMLSTVQDMLFKVHKHYHYSPKALRELRAIADAMEERVLKPKRLQGTRWLPHIMQATDALMNGYKVIRTHFEHVSQAGPGVTTDSVKGRAKFLATKLKDYRVLRYMHCLQDILEVVSIFSLRLQTTGLTCVDYLDALEAANLMLIELREQPGPHFKALEQETLMKDGEAFFKGMKVTNYDPENTTYDFQGVVDKVFERMNLRMESDQPTLQLARVFDTKDWPRSKNDLAAYGNSEVDSLTKHFDAVLTRNECETALIPSEWMLAKAHLGRKIQNNLSELPTISDLFLLDERFKNLLHLVEIVLTLPMSSATCERGFSAVKRIKSDWRANLTTETMNALLCVSVEGPPLQTYDAQQALHLWWTSGPRSRRPQFEAETTTSSPSLKSC